MWSTYGRHAVGQHYYKADESSGVKILQISTSDVLKQERLRVDYKGQELSL
jgi:hypothetical protein